MFDFLTSGAKEAADPLVSAKSVSGWLRQLAGAGRHRPPAARDARIRGDAPVAQGRRPRARAGDRIPRCRARRRSPPADQAVRRERTTPPPSSPMRIWQAVYDLSQGFIYRLPDGARGGAARRAPTRAGSRWCRCCSRGCVHYYGTDAKLRVFRFERWIPGQVDGAAPHLPARHRAGRRARACGAAQRRPERDAVDGRAGIPLRAADPPAQHRQHVAAAARLGDGAVARLEPPAADSTRCRARPKASSSISPARRGWPAVRATTPARCCAISTRRRWPSSSSARSARCGRPRPTDQGPAGPINQLRIAILEKVSPSVSPNLNAELRRDPRIACAVAAKVRIGLSRICHELMQKDTDVVDGRQRGGRADRGVRGGRRHALAATRAGRARFAGGEPVVVLRSDVAGQGPQRRGPAHRCVRRHWPERSRWARWSPCGNPISPTGCWASCVA